MVPQDSKSDLPLIEGMYTVTYFLILGDTDCSQDQCHEGASDVISRSALLRIVLFFLIIFLVSGCTIVVMVSA